MKKFTFYKLLSLVLMLVLSVSTIKSFNATNILKAEAVVPTVTSQNILDEEVVTKFKPILLKSNNTVNELDVNNVLLRKGIPGEDEIIVEVIEKESVEESSTEESVIIEPEEEVKPQEVITDPQVVGNYSEWEIYEWAKIVYCEARGESQKCREYIAQVILNRINSSRYPNTVHGVIFQSNQFSPTFDGSWERLEPNQAAYDAVYTVINASQPLTNALFFEACRGDSWHSRNLTEVAEVDNTRFYTY